MKTIFVLMAITSAFSSSAFAIEGPGQSQYTADSTAFFLDETVGGVSATSQGTSDVSNRHMKIIIAAKEDAAYFLATDGQARSARFNQALQVVRSMNPESTASDMELALEIVNLSLP